MSTTIDLPTPTKGPCQSFIKVPRKDAQSSVTYEKCSNPGEGRWDNTLYCGTHCPSCWAELVYESRRQSW